jgi:hypothetical protein
MAKIHTVENTGYIEYTTSHETFTLTQAWAIQSPVGLGRQGLEGLGNTGPIRPAKFRAHKARGMQGPVQQARGIQGTLCKGNLEFTRPWKSRAHSP